MVADDAQKKTNHFETELYKALDLAHDYQEKCKQLTAGKKESEERMETLLADKDKLIKSKDEEIEALKENYETIMRLNKQSTDCVRNVEDALGKFKTYPKLQLPSEVTYIKSDRGGKRLLVILLALLWGMEIGFKFASRTVIYLLNPCHVTTLIQIYLLAAPPSKTPVPLGLLCQIKNICAINYSN